MIKKTKKRYTKTQVLKYLDPIIKEWFDNKYTDLTPPQARAIPLIHKGKNVLVASPTGSGKTLTAFLMIINELFELSREKKLENKVYCVYISPLKALANDIERNLNSPLKQIYALAEKHGITLPEIRVGVRSGDTSSSERQKMVRKPPHILITTPESLSLIVSTKRFRLKLQDTRFVIVDEIHEICSSKRGVQLSLNLERFQHQILTEGLGREFVRIGLSATQAPIIEIAKFLVGYNKDRKLRDINIIEASAGKKLELRIVCPVQDMNLIPFEIVNAKMYNILIDLIKNHRTTLIFTNTRSGTETVVYKLQEHGLNQIAAHHGSLSKTTRLEVEEKLKNGELDATICSTSLELGIDIGYIDLVCQIGSPKSIAKGLQRIGRAGHALHKISKGRIIVFDRDDLVECAVLVKNVYLGNIDRINILKNSLDVLAQVLVGMSLEKRWDISEAYSLIRQSYCYHRLSHSEFLNVLRYLGGKHTMEEKGIYGKLRFDPDTQTFGIRSGARIIHNLNIGTIPQEASYKVTLVDSGHTLGMLSEKFVERLAGHDVFVLGGKSYEFIQVRGMRVYVRDAHGKKPTVPSWTGEMLPRSFDLSCEIGKFRSELTRRITTFSHEEVEQWLKEEYYLDSGSAKSIMNYFIEQIGLIKELPANDKILIEGYIDGRGFSNIIFHYCFGRRVNDALSRAYAYALSTKLKCTVRISLTDDNFMLTLPKRVELTGIESIITHDTLYKYLKGALRNSELFKQRFRHCAVRSFMILRNYKGKEISVRKQLRRSLRILDLLHEQNNFPVINESYNEIMHDAMDIRHAEEVLKKISNKDISVCYSDYSMIPSPFAHNVVLMGVSDIILMEDRSALLRELHQQVLTKVFSDLQLSTPKFDLDIVKKYFNNKFPTVKDKSSLYSALKNIGPLRLFKERGKNIYSLTTEPRQRVQEWAHELINERKLISVVRNNEVFWIPRSQLKLYLRVYSDRTKLTGDEKRVLDWLASSRDSEYETEPNTAITKDKIDFESSVDFLVLQYLKYYAPSPVSEIAYDLGLKEAVITRTLTGLEDAASVVASNYILGKDVPQYMLAQDLAILEQSRTSELQVVAEKSVSDYLFNKNFTQVNNIEEYFEKFGLAFSKREVFVRTKKFSLEIWEKYLATGKIVQGRFLNGHVCFVPASEAPMYVSAYRKAQLTEQEFTVLNIIKRHRGITRQELAKKLEARQADLKDIIEKLERNLYIIRELQNYDTKARGELDTRSSGSSGAIANKYMFYDLTENVVNSEHMIVQRLLFGFSPMTALDIQNYTGFSMEVIENYLDSLVDSGELIKFMAVGEDNSEMFTHSTDFELLSSEKVTINSTEKVKLLSFFDSYTTRVLTELRAKFGDGWKTSIIYSGHLVGILDMWRLTSCIEIRGIALDDEGIARIYRRDTTRPTGVNVGQYKLNILKQILDELDRLMEYYKLSGLDIIRIRNIFDHDPDSLPAELGKVLEAAGYKKVQRFFAKGKLDLRVFNYKQIMNFIFENQHLLPKSRFTNPLDVIREMGGIRSNFEMQLRLDGKFYDIKEFRKNLNLTAGSMIPKYYMYCTEIDLQIYKAAKARELDFNMEYMLDNMPDDFGISGRNLFNRITLTKEQFNKARKQLFEGLFIIRDTMNRFRKVKSHPHMTTQYARKFILKRIIRNFGIFSLENLTAFSKHEFSMKELRRLLSELEFEGELIKGYFLENDDTLYWIHKDTISEKIPDKPRFTKRFIVSPQDQFATYLAPIIRQRFGAGTWFIIFHGFEITGVFQIKQQNKRVWITDFIGEPDEKNAVERFFSANKLELVDEETEELY